MHSSIRNTQSYPPKCIITFVDGLFIEKYIMLSLRKIFTVCPAISYRLYTTPQITSSYYTNYRHKLTDSAAATVTRAPTFRFSPSTLAAEPSLDQPCDPARLTLQLEKSLKENRLEDAWKAYENHSSKAGLLHKSLLTKLVIGLTESFDPHWLQKAYSIVDLVPERNELGLLESEPLVYLSFILARCNLPVLALNTMRKLIKLELYPPVSAWSGIVAHMCQTETGSLLAAELIIEIGCLLRDNCLDPRKVTNRHLLSMKPNSFVFNIALTGCLVFGLTKKAEQLLDVMLWIRLHPEPDLLITVARVYEKNCHRDEVRKLKRHVDQAVGITALDLQEFYDCLFSCELKFGNFGSCIVMVLNMLQKAKEAKNSLEAENFVYPPNQKSENESIWVKTLPPSFHSFSNDAKLLTPEIEGMELLGMLSNRLRSQAELVKSEHGILYPTDKLYAKLIRAFLEAGRTADLVSFLIKANKLKSLGSLEISAVVKVTNACIYLGLLDQAHDLLDEMRYSRINICPSVYHKLLIAYSRANRQDEVIALLKEARRDGIQLDSSCYEAISQSQVTGDNLNTTQCNVRKMKDSNISETSTQVQINELGDRINPFDVASLAFKIIEEMKQNPGIDRELHDWNSTIHFFCKKRLIDDAQKALNKMRSAGHTPNAQTFHSLVTAYAAMGGKYTEVTELWGEMKILAGSQLLRFDQELLDSLLHCLVRGGFFLRAMEVIEMMETGDMFIDKYKYKSLWLNYHATLYKAKDQKVQTDAQQRRREAALAFSRWIGLT